MKKTYCKRGYEIKDPKTGKKGCFIPHNQEYENNASYKVVVVKTQNNENVTRVSTQIYNNSKPQSFNYTVKKLK